MVDAILTIIGFAAAVVSICGGYKSLKYYRKSKVISAHTSINYAIIEIEKMLNKLPEALGATNACRRNSRGSNLEKTICEIGEELSKSYNKIRSSIPSEFSSRIFAKDKKDSFDLRRYIDSYISGDALQERGLNSEDYAACQNCLLEMLDDMKRELDKVEEEINK